ncbi:hypothetical protein MtrunA17_Chr3g0144721 [Medicago truncatula]|uniref:Uncharacterized protein n=1 Tax=Medicago truncatula TaxID=3880 RepID=A0A396J0H0_MEDTR|nr:hypothetical protein MtrunA17_Chr3g0144721 [Medicago truncatula]
MQSRKIVNDGLVAEKKEDNNDQNVHVDSATALQQFLDHIPISSISGINNSHGTTTTFYN